MFFTQFIQVKERNITADRWIAVLRQCFSFFSLPLKTLSLHSFIRLIAINICIVMNCCCCCRSLIHKTSTEQQTNKYKTNKKKTLMFVYLSSSPPPSRPLPSPPPSSESFHFQFSNFLTSKFSVCFLFLSLSNFYW